MTENFISHLEEQIRHHNDLYWKKGTPEISDVEYDRLVETLRSWDPENPLLKKVEAPMRELVRSGVDYTDDSEKIAASRRRIAFWIERLKQK